MAAVWALRIEDAVAARKGSASASSDCARQRGWSQAKPGQKGLDGHCPMLTVVKLPRWTGTGQGPGRA